MFSSLRDMFEYVVIILEKQTQVNSMYVRVEYTTHGFRQTHAFCGYFVATVPDQESDKIDIRALQKIGITVFPKQAFKTSVHFDHRQYIARDIMISIEKSPFLEKWYNEFKLIETIKDPTRDLTVIEFTIP